jgi:hypothetical protein
LRILAEDELTKPTKPDEVDGDAILDSLRNQYAQVRKAPGDPVLFFELFEEQFITPLSQCAP